MFAFFVVPLRSNSDTMGYNSNIIGRRHEQDILTACVGPVITPVGAVVLQVPTKYY